MSAALFPDNTVLCNFAAVDRLDLLESHFRGRGRWTQAVEHEWSQSAGHYRLTRGTAVEQWMGEAITVEDGADIEQVQRIRRRFAAPSDGPTKHLGEAETCFVLTEWERFRDAWWISDDREALRFARFRDITTRETVDVVTAIVADGELTADQGYDLMHAMADRDRHLRLPESVQELTR